MAECSKTKSASGSASKRIRRQIQIVISEVCIEVSRAERVRRRSGPGIVICMPDSLMVGREWLPW
jgi:hypothetical protein